MTPGQQHCTVLTSGRSVWAHDPVAHYGAIHYMLQQTNFPLSEPATFCFIGKGKGNVDLYSTSSRMSLTSSDMDHIVLPANITISAFTRKHSHVAPPHICIANAPEFNLLLIYRPEEDEWLSLQFWLPYSRRFTWRRSPVNCTWWRRPEKVCRS